MPDYIARVRAKGLDSTGVTEELAKQFFSTLGSHHMAVIEFRVEDRKENADGKHTVDLVITQLEPSTATFLDDHLRELTRAMYRNRALAEDGVMPETLNGPDLRDVVKGSGGAVIARDSEGNPNGVWDGSMDDGDHVGACAFPGCHMPFGHDGDHDVFTEPAPEPALAD